MTETANSTTRAKVLEIAWQHFAELDKNGEQAQNRHRTLRATVTILSVVAAFLAVLSQVIDTTVGVSLLPELIRVGLLIVPIAGSMVLAFANKFYPGEYWLALRTGAEELKREIYLYRSILRGQTDRHLWLNERVATIQKQVTETLGGNLVLDQYTGEIPPYYSPDNDNSDPGFHDLSVNDYLRYRLQDQMNWHRKKARKFQTERRYIQITIFLFGGLGTVLAAYGSPATAWVAVTAAIAAGFTAWTELNRYEEVISNYNFVVAELRSIEDYWTGLSPDEQTGDEYVRLVVATERVLWSQHSKFISEMQRAVAELREESEDMVDKVIKMPATIDPDEALTGRTPEPAEDTHEAKHGEEEDRAPRGLPHAFVVMPFGRKQGPDGNWTDFDSIYQQLIRPALAEAGFEPFRADEEQVSGNILTDMFQELLLADLVIADLSIDNANVFYELGVRHAFRKRGIIHIQSGRAYMPFDIFNVRTIPYQCDKSGKPDPKQVANDKKTIVRAIRETWASNRERVHSPIFELLDGLSEPDRKDLKTPLATGFWQEYETWEQLVQIALRQNHIGDILLLTEEVPNPLFQEEAIAKAGQALKNSENYPLALEQYQQGLKINPKNKGFRREEIFHLGRLKRHDEAVEKLERLLQEFPDDSESIAFMGRFYKDMWKEAWFSIEAEQERLKAAFDAGYLLKKSIESYLKGFGINQNHYYSGINALSLSLILEHLFQKFSPKDSLDPKVEEIRQQIPPLAGAVQFSIEQSIKKNPADYWACASLGDLAVCVAKDPEEVIRTYRDALVLSGKKKFPLRSTFEQLEILNMLDFRLDYVHVGMKVLQAALDKLEEADQDVGDKKDQDARRVFLFAGHMIDHQDRSVPRFPADMEDEAREKIIKELAELEANENDLAITPGAACGGDILFIEACLKKEMSVQVYLPYQPRQFIRESVSFPKKEDSEWLERYYKISNDPNVTFHLQPDRIGPPPEGVSPFERNNRWTLYSALGHGIDRMRAIVLWDGQEGDGPGGTSHMVEEVRRLGGIVKHIDTTAFNYWPEREGVNLGE